MTQQELESQHETAFVRSFVIRERRERYASMLTSKKKRSKFLDRLNHKFIQDLKQEYVALNQPRDLPSDDHQCWIIASQPNDDAQFLPYSDVSDFLRGSLFGVLVSVVPGRLAIYKDEAPADSIWLKRTRNAG